MTPRFAAFAVSIALVSGCSGASTDFFPAAAADAGAVTSDASSGASSADATAGSDASPAPCAGATKACGDRCVDVDDPGYGCGVTGCAPCSLAHATAGCLGGACAVAECARGYEDCDKVGSNGCEVDLTGSHDHCGTCIRVCNAGQVCSAGACGSTCEAGRTACAGSCVDLGTDDANCGGCGIACGARASCEDGKCVSTAVDAGVDASGDAGACGLPGACTAGTYTVTTSGCTSGQHRVLYCDDSCHETLYADCATCGTVGADCCGLHCDASAGAVCSAPAFPSTQTQCIPCGAPGQPCCAGSCTGATCEATNGNGFYGDTCVVSGPPGAPGAPCATGSTCDATHLCSDNTCVMCGDLFEACCPSGVCRNGTCSPLPFGNQICQ